MHTAFIECELRDGSTMAELTARLERLGVLPIPGYEPSLMQAEPDRDATVMFTMTVPDHIDSSALRNIPGVVGVFGDATIAPFHAR